MTGLHDLAYPPMRRGRDPLQVGADRTSGGV